MPTKKPTRAASPSARDLASVLATATYPPDAAGASRAKGLGVSPAVDAFLGLGFPHMIVVTGEPLGAVADRAALAERYPRADGVMPREAVDLHYTIAGLVLDGDTSPALPKPAKPKLPKAIDDALRFRTGWTALELEVMFGTLPVLEALVARLSALKPAAWEKANGAGAILRAAVPWMLWRVPARDRERLLTALRAIREPLGKHAGWPAAKQLDVVTGGRAGIERSGRTLSGALHLGTLSFAYDDPDWAKDQALTILETLRPQDREHFDPQLVVLAPKLLPHLRKSVAKFLTDERPRMEARLALFA